MIPPYVFTLIQGVVVSLGSYFGYLAISTIYDKNGFLILLWSLLPSTFYTSFNSLPDATADSFFWISIFFLLSNKNLLSAIFISIAILSREVYIFIPLIMISIKVFDIYKNNFNKYIKIKFLKIFSNRPIIYYSIPLFAFVLWRLNVFLNVGSSSSGDVLGSPIDLYNQLINSYQSPQFWGLIIHSLLVITLFVSSLNGINNIIKMKKIKLLNDNSLNLYTFLVVTCLD